MKDNKDLKARERSVGHLQMLYIIVVGIAITYILESFVRCMLDSGTLEINKCVEMFFIVIAFMFTIIPFVHGANRYLDATYVTCERTAKPFSLLIDFLFLFSQAVLFFVMAVLADNRDFFYSTLVILLLIDIIWIATTCFTTVSDATEKALFRKWLLINAVAAILIFISVWSNVLSIEIWKGECIKNIVLLVIAIGRTIVDYYFVWAFYYPSSETPTASELN